MSSRGDNSGLFPMMPRLRSRRPAETVRDRGIALPARLFTPFTTQALARQRSLGRASLRSRSLRMTREGKAASPTTLLVDDHVALEALQLRRPAPHVLADLALELFHRRPWPVLVELTLPLPRPHADARERVHDRLGERVEIDRDEEILLDARDFGGIHRLSEFRLELVERLPGPRRLERLELVRIHAGNEQELGIGAAIEVHVNEQSCRRAPFAAPWSSPSTPRMLSSRHGSASDAPLSD